MRRKWFAAAIMAFVIQAGPVIPMESTNETLIDKEACPFECCTYRTWSVEKETELLGKPVIGSETTASLKPGMKVEAITGEVHITAGIFLVEKKFSSYKPGDILQVFTYLGEGHFKVRFNGQMNEEDLNCSPYGSTAYTSDLGTFETKPVFVWWVLIQAPDGEMGWTNLPDNFGNKDACS